MSRRFAELAFTPLVKEQQEKHGSRRSYARMEEIGEAGDRLGEFEQEFIASRDGFYMASTSETGWPYIQHRGGPAGFPPSPLHEISRPVSRVLCDGGASPAA